MSLENRTAPRVVVDVRGVLKREIDPNFSDMMMSNLSLGGCFIKTSVPEPAGSVVMLRFSLPGSDVSASIKAVGKVCWVKEGGDGPLGMGVQFVSVDDADRSTLVQYISGLLSEDLFDD
jgi:uncharacterized protein (TIGR02266 family)